MTINASVDDFRLLDPATLAEPYEYWRALRESAPVHAVSEGVGYTIVTRYADVKAALRDPETFSNQLSRRFQSGMSAYKDSEAVQAVMANACPYADALAFSDGETHNKHRKMVRRGFTLARVRELDALVEQTVDEFLDELVSGDEVDFWRRFCVRLPIRIIGHILGVEGDREDDVKRWADAQVHRFGEPRETEEENLSIARDLVDFHQYLYAALAERREQPRDDFLTDLVQASDGVTENELVLICAQLLVAGAESSTSLIGSMVNQLLDHPDQLQKLREDPSLIPGAVEETLRAESPIKLVHRVTTRDVELGGGRIPADSLVLLMIASANRDEDVFTDAETFDITREDARTHFAFGMGSHLCSGAELARSEGRIALERLVARTSSITRAEGPAPVHPPNLTVRALKTLPVILHPADTSA
ncbi:cytochrome P450 [Rhodococcus koreensis]